MLKILYISHLHPPKDAPLENMGGMQRVSMQLVNELKSRDNIEVKTVIQHAPWKGIEWRTAIFLAKLKFRLPKIVREYKPDVILFSSMVTASLAKFTRKQIDVPMVTINHGQDVTMPVGLYQKLVPKVFDALDGVISVSEATREQCIQRGMNPEKGIALPNGFELADFEEVPDREISRKAIEQQFNIDLEDKGLLLTVGRQVKRKGHAWFLREVLPNIKSDVVYVAIGDGPEHESLREMVSNSPYKEHIVLAGRQPDEILKQAYAAADIFIMPNISVAGDMEGFGIVLLEANLASTFAVASDLEGIKDVIKNGVNGFKIPEGDAKLFAQKIDRVLSANPQDYGRQSSAFVRENFTWNSVADRYISYLTQITENRTSAARR
jgi:phosphatidylinositol alpha-1,6-mannosyltransferase